jgi:uncharacterized protein (DUF169 family)
MADWEEVSREVERLLRLKTYPVAYKRLEKAEELEKIPKIQRFDRIFNFCQLPTLVRRGGWTVGVTKDNVGARCARLNGLAATTEEAQRREAAIFGTYSWFATAEVAMQQQAAYPPLIPPGEALVLAPLAGIKFDPDVILIYGDPAQLMLLMCGLQFKDYERFQFYFTGEGACVDSLAQCYMSGKPSLAIPCWGERRLGGVTDEELVIALPPGMMGRAIEGMRGLAERGMRFPMRYRGTEMSAESGLASVYPGPTRTASEIGYKLIQQR